MVQRDSAAFLRALKADLARLHARLPNRLEAWRLAASAVLWVEAATTLLWRPLAWASFCAALALLDLAPARLLGSVAGPLAMLALTLLPFAALLRQGRAQLRLPNQSAAERRLERDANLPHRPFATLRDQPSAGPSPLWAAHQARAQAALARLRLAFPNAGLARQDQHALRAASLLLLIAGLTIAGPEAIPRLLAAYLPGAALFSSTHPTIQAWIEPPRYTGLSPIFLSATTQTISVPDGAKLHLTVTGPALTPRLSLDGHRLKLRALGENSFTAEATLHRQGHLRLATWLSTLAQWQLTLLPNPPPEANWSAPPARAGRTLETRFPWHTAHPWGVATLQLELRPESGPDIAADLPPITLPIPLPGTPKDATGNLQIDLSANPYAGVKMQGVLIAHDVSGQEGRSSPAFITLPERHFQNALARAIIELRRRLALRQETAADGAADLEALTPAPKKFEGHSGIWLNTQAIIAMLRQSRSIAVLDSAEARLWILALDLDGALPSDSETALKTARDELKHALEQHSRGEITDPELAQKLQKLRDALAQRLADMARQAARDGKLPNFDPKGQHFTSPGIERTLRDIERLAREGHQEEARRKLAELENLLDKLPQAKVLTPEQAREAQAAQKEAKKRQEAVKDLIQREAGLMDNAQARAPRPAPLNRHLQLPPGMQFFGPMGQIMPQPPQGEDQPDAALPPPPDPDQLEANEESRSNDARTQRALRQALHALQRALGPGAPQKLNEASTAMGEANEALIAGREPAARSAEARAIEALRQGGSDMNNQAQQGAQMAIIPGAGAPDGEDELAEEPGDGSGDAKLDPLGRPLSQGAGGHATDDHSVKVPDAMEAARSRAIQEELRRRGAERARPQQELDYIDRLLKPF